MTINLRQPTAEDVAPIARLVFDAFASIHDRHQFPRDFPSLESATGLAHAWVVHPKIWGVVAERDGEIVGCNFLDQRNSVAAIGPVCVDPKQQGSGVGRRVMQAVIDHSREVGATSVRLMQDAFNTTSMSLYTSFGFNVNEPIALMRGKFTSAPSANAVARLMTPADLPACGELYRAAHGFDRTGELTDALTMFRPFVLERGGKIRAYLASSVFWAMNHGVAETPQDMKDLLVGTAAQSGEPISFAVPTRNSEFFRWCLAERLRMIKPMTLMTLGDYREPVGWWFPSVEY